MATIYLHPTVICDPFLVSIVEIKTRMVAEPDGKRRVVMKSKECKIVMPVVVMNARKEFKQ